MNRNADTVTHQQKQQAGKGTMAESNHQHRVRRTHDLLQRLRKSMMGGGPQPEPAGSSNKHNKSNNKSNNNNNNNNNSILLKALQVLSTKRTRKNNNKNNNDRRVPLVGTGAATKPKPAANLSTARKTVSTTNAAAAAANTNNNNNTKTKTKNPRLVPGAGKKTAAAAKGLRFAGFGPRPAVTAAGSAVAAIDRRSLTAATAGVSGSRITTPTVIGNHIRCCEDLDDDGDGDGDGDDFSVEELDDPEVPTPWEPRNHDPARHSGLLETLAGGGGRKTTGQPRPRQQRWEIGETVEVRPPGGGGLSDFARIIGWNDDDDDDDDDDGDGGTYNLIDIFTGTYKKRISPDRIIGGYDDLLNDEFAEPPPSKKTKTTELFQE